jgi:hypothetical protein
MAGSGEDKQVLSAMSALLTNPRGALDESGLNERQKLTLQALRFQAETTRLKAETAENELRMRRARIDTNSLAKAFAAIEVKEGQET